MDGQNLAFKDLANSSHNISSPVYLLNLVNLFFLLIISTRILTVRNTVRFARAGGHVVYNILPIHNRGVEQAPICFDTDITAETNGIQFVAISFRNPTIRSKAARVRLASVAAEAPITRLTPQHSDTCNVVLRVAYAAGMSGVYLHRCSIAQVGLPVQ